MITIQLHGKLEAFFPPENSPQVDPEDGLGCPGHATLKSLEAIREPTKLRFQ
jgi:hypothetical protein